MNEIFPARQVGIVPAHLQEAGVPQMEWPALSPNFSPMSNLWDQLGCHREGGHLAPVTLMTYE